MRLLLLFLAATSHALEQPRGKATAKTIRTTKADVEAVAITQALQNIKLKVTGGATTGLAHRLEVGAFFGGWYALNIYYNIINKKVLKTVGLPWLVSWAQLVVGALYAMVGWTIGRPGPSSVSAAVKDAWPVAVAHCGQQVTTVISLGAGAVSMTHVVKALEPLFSAAVNAVVRGEILPLPVYAALVPVVGGVAVAIATDLSFNPLSFSAAMTSNLFSGLRAVLSKANLERTKQTAPELFGAATIGAACILAPLAFFVEGGKLSGSLDDLDTNRVALQVALSGLFHCSRCGVLLVIRSTSRRWRRGGSSHGVASMACMMPGRRDAVDAMPRWRRQRVYASRKSFRDGVVHTQTSTTRSCTCAWQE